MLLQITPYRAGHVLGAAMFLIDIGGMRALYTGDYSRVTDRHLSAADMPPVKPHIGGPTVMEPGLASSSSNREGL